MGYVLLAGAITAQVGARTAMKYSEGFSGPLPSLVTVLGCLVSVALLSRTPRTVPVGTAYAVGAGVGTAAVATIGVVFPGEGLTAAKAAGLGLIVAGVVVLSLGGAH